MIDNNEVLPLLQQLLDKQNRKGIDEYGVPLHASELSTAELLEYAMEELVDAMQYVKVAHDRLKNNGGN